MTRIKEPAFGSTTQITFYKSPVSRIVKSLRTAYDNARERLADKSKTLMSLQGKLRDTQNSRDDWKRRAKIAEAQLAELQQKNIVLKSDLKKRESGP